MKSSCCKAPVETNTSDEGTSHWECSRCGKACNIATKPIRIQRKLMNTPNDFEDYLASQHAKQYTGTDDLMPDDFEDWLENLDKQELIEFADKYVASLTTQRIEAIRNDKKSVKELLPVMGEAYNDLSVQVAYKEGYNRGHVDVITLLEEEL